MHIWPTNPNWDSLQSILWKSIWILYIPSLSDCHLSPVDTQCSLNCGSKPAQEPNYVADLLVFSFFFFKYDSASEKYLRSLFILFWFMETLNSPESEPVMFKAWVDVLCGFFHVLVGIRVFIFLSLLQSTRWCSVYFLLSSKGKCKRRRTNWEEY